ncbi:MAG: hypothetical protein A2Z34_11345 [Planctomycetes bacterium RBG_16_59_8]|nr:MAG: hypothetical protein A2Z34_11345 [Planctomycetes bacterium RBG_16_59_8]
MRGMIVAIDKILRELKLPAGKTAVVGRPEAALPEGITVIPSAALRKQSGEYDNLFFLGALLRDIPAEEIFTVLRRIIRPGGRLVLVDDFGNEEIPVEQQDRAPRDKEKIIPDMLYDQGFRSVAYTSGPAGAYWTAVKFEQESRGVSLALLCHNQERYLRKGIYAALAQTYPALEIIVVNEGSRDKTTEILEKEFATIPQIKVVTHKEPKGVAASLNEAFGIATGDYLTWTGVDNILFPPMIEVLTSHLDTYPELGGVYSDYVVTDENGRFCYNVDLPDFTPRGLLERYIVGVSFLIRRTAYEKVGGCNERLRLSEDYELWLKIAEHYPLKRVPERLYGYRFHGKHLDPERKTRRRRQMEEVRKISDELRRRFAGSFGKERQG